jgi:D-alanyl-D-alanine carboxypeptidase
MPPQLEMNQTEKVETPPLEAPSAPAIETSAAPAARSYTRPILGLAFLSISVIGGLGVLVALIPSVAYEEPHTQLAAAAAERAEPFKGLEVGATSAFVYDVRRDSELYAKNSSAQLPLASLTKVMLVLAVAEVLPLDATITISREAVEKGGGGLTWGEEWKVRDLIDFTLITSSNTGAEALSEAAQPLLAQKYPEGSQANATVWRMNALAQSLGMRETYFVNVTGLDESPTQAGAQGSARDVAALFAYALRTNPTLFAGTTHTDVALGPANFPERSAHNTNNALAEIEGLQMGKTGTTDLAGGNLAIAFAAAEERPIIVVVLGSTPEGRYADISALVTAAREAISND